MILRLRNSDICLYTGKRYDKTYQLCSRKFCMIHNGLEMARLTHKPPPPMHDRFFLTGVHFSLLLGGGLAEAEQILWIDDFSERSNRKYKYDRIIQKIIHIC